MPPLLSVLLQTVGAPSNALPRASVAVTASWIVSPIEVAVSAVGEMPTHRTAAARLPSPASPALELGLERVGVGENGHQPRSGGDDTRAPSPRIADQAMRPQGR